MNIHNNINQDSIVIEEIEELNNNDFKNKKASSIKKNINPKKSNINKNNIKYNNIQNINNDSEEIIELKSDEVSEEIRVKKIILNKHIKRDEEIEDNKEANKNDNKKNLDKLLKTKIINKNSSIDGCEEENMETKKKIKNDNKIQNDDNLSLSEQSENGNFNQVLFDYKNYQENNLPTKRKNDLENELKDLKIETDNIMKQKKQGWIAKNQTKVTPIKLKPFINDEVEKNYSQNDDNNSPNKKNIHKNKLEDSYKDSLDDLMDLDDNLNKKIDVDKNSNPNLNKKEVENNFNENLDKSDENTTKKKNKMSKYQEYLRHRNQNDNKINDYEEEYKTLEDEEQQTYDDFFKMKHNNRKIIPGRNNKFNEDKNKEIEYSRNKKEREKMKGHKCELCQKFYDCVSEEGLDNLCQDCSRHRTNEPINKTPKGFYDLTL